MVVLWCRATLLYGTHIRLVCMASEDKEQYVATKKQRLKRTACMYG